MSKVIDGIKYTKTHEWVKKDGDCFVIGVTDFAQSELSDVVYADLTEAGENIVAGGGIGVLESVKAAEEIYSPIAGVISEINNELIDSPQLINEDPYGAGWLVKIKDGNDADFDLLLSADDYRAIVE